MLNWFNRKKAFQSVSAEQVEGFLLTGEGQALDVRTREEFASGHLPGATQLDVQSVDFVRQLEKLDPEKPYYVYCRSGGRSTRACQRMTDQGFKQVHNLVGGLGGWKGKIVTDS
ncbi:MAG: rhodanese-like domain-containing protein [Ferruginibacter sp.]|nr:rhodanese-like domain-containing protein [Cytophagales bacterium]